jgi:omega-amidase
MFKAPAKSTQIKSKNIATNNSNSHPNIKPTSKKHHLIKPSQVNIHSTTKKQTKLIKKIPQLSFSTTSQMSTEPTPPTTPNTLRIGLCQISVTPNKDKNLTTAKNAIEQAIQKGAKLVVLPECFQCPYDTGAFPLYQEPIPQVGTRNDQLDAEINKSTAFLSKIAKDNQIFIIGGSIPESGLVDGKPATYNTSVVFDYEGTIVAKHRKLHLFDINIPGRITFRESDSLTPGNQITTFSIPTRIDENNGKNGKNGKNTEKMEFLSNLSETFRSQVTIGLGICYDIRFSEYALCARQFYNADAIVYPGAFNMTTGPAHWELLQKARALDNQMYVLSCSPARSIPNDPENVDQSGKPYAYVAWGHSTAVGPWGDVIATTEHESDVVIADLDFDKMDQIRAQIPISTQRKADVYKLLHEPTTQAL